MKWLGFILALLPGLAWAAPMQSSQSSNLPIANASVAINIGAPGTSLLVPGTPTTHIFVAAWDVMANGDGTLQLEYGSGSGCATPTPLTGVYRLSAGQEGPGSGSGLGALFTLPLGASLCAIATAPLAGSLSYTQY